MKKIDTGTKIVIALVTVLFAFIGLMVWTGTRPPMTYQFELSEISDGVYAYLGTAVSSIPAENYTMATVCDGSGNMYTIKGTVRVVNYIDSVPYAIWEDYNIVNADVITIYAPTNTAEYLGTVSVRRR